MVLVNILRTDLHVHRALPADTECARLIAILACVCRDAAWWRTRAGNDLRSLLRECWRSGAADGMSDVSSAAPPRPPAKSSALDALL